MRKKIKQIVCVLLMMGLMLGTIHYEVTPVEAAGVSLDTETEYYEWHRAYSADDLKKYTNADGETTNYKGKWVPIIIVACYGSDDNQTMYYWNRACEQGKYCKPEVNPYMTTLDGTTETGLYLKNAIENGKEDGFITRGDMSALHMYYHGTQTSSRMGGEITEDAWSLTSEDVSYYSSDNPGTVWGFNYFFGLALDVNKVLKWNGADKLPKTKSDNDSDYEYEQGWTFYNDNKQGQFLISNVFAWPLSKKLDSDVYAPTLGGAYFWGNYLGKNYNFPYLKARNVLQSPLWVSANIWDSSTGKIKTGNAAREAILSKYNSEYNSHSDSAELRVNFRVYVGEKMDTQGGTLKNMTITDGMTQTISYGSSLESGSSITVEKGGTLIIPEDGLFYLDGTIYVNGGTVIVGRNACITSEETTAVRTNNKEVNQGLTGRIECNSGGSLLIQSNAKIYLNHGLTLLDYSTCVNNGMLILNQLLHMENSELQIKANGYLGLGFSYGKQSRLFVLETKHASQNLYNSDNTSNYRPSAMELNINENNRILVEGTAGSGIESKIEMSRLAYLFINNRETVRKYLDNFAQSCILFDDNEESPSVENGNFQFASATNDQDTDTGEEKTVYLKLNYRSTGGAYTGKNVKSGVLNKGYMILKYK